MKYELQTIPIHTSLDKNTECCLCELMKESLEHSLDYFLGSSVMNPETRVKVNNIGFCPEHFTDLASKNKAQSLSLLCDTFIEQTLKTYDKDYKIKGNIDKSIDNINKEIDKRYKGCLICDKLELSIKRYSYTVVYLWKTEPEFREKLKNSKGFCMYHTKDVLNISKEALNKKERKEFVEFIMFLEKTKLERLKNEVYHVTQMYKSENKGMSWNGCEDAHKRAVKSMVGCARIKL